MLAGALILSACAEGGTSPSDFPEDVKACKQAMAYRSMTTPTFIEVVSAAPLRDGSGIQMFLTHNGQNMTICRTNNGHEVKEPSPTAEGRKVDEVGGASCAPPRPGKGSSIMTAKPDFPFYNDRPIPFEGRDWLLLMGALAVALAVLTLLPLRHFPQDIVPALLFLAIPLLALRHVAGRHWTAMFRPVGLREIGLMLLFGLLTLGDRSSRR